VTNRAAYESSLAEALEAESSANWLRSHVLCEQALLHAPEDPDALNLLGRLCAVAGDRSRSIALQSFVLHLAPNHPRAGADLDDARRAIVSSSEARQAFEEAVRLEPDITYHYRYFFSLEPFVGMDRVEELLRACLALDPSHAHAHAAIGNLKARRGEWLAAIESYGTATMLQWDFPEAHLALADLLHSVREESIARNHIAEALADRQLYEAGAIAANADRRILVLAAPGGVLENAPLDMLVNPARTALNRYYFVDGVLEPVDFPAHDLVYNGIEELEGSASAIARAAGFMDATSKPAINHPRNLARTRRSALRESLAGAGDCIVPETVRIERSRLETHAAPAAALELHFPLLIRPIDAHRGDGLERLSNDRDLHDYLLRHESPAFTISPFVDYRSSDGYYRKYRTVVVDGVPYPYHLAISDRWMVHYTGSLMEHYAWMREEEERFLREPSAVFPRWDETFGDVAHALGLEYFGVDHGVTKDGAILIFECSAGMLVHCREDPAMFGYKYRYVPRIFDAFDRLLRERRLTAAAR
jgi:tetratricopeptide (TPR) repeat protein